MMIVSKLTISASRLQSVARVAFEPLPGPREAPESQHRPGAASVVKGRRGTGQDGWFRRVMAQKWSVRQAAMGQSASQSGGDGPPPREGSGRRMSESGQEATERRTAATPEGGGPPAGPAPGS